MTKTEEAFTRELRALLKLTQIQAVIDFVISQGQTVNYITLAKPFGLFSGGSELAELLGKIFDADYAAKKPTRTAAVVRSDTGMPGFGFYNMAFDLDLCDLRVQSKIDFWLDTMRKLELEPPELSRSTIENYQKPFPPCTGDGIAITSCGNDVNHTGMRNGVPVRTCGVHIVGAEKIQQFRP